MLLDLLGSLIFPVLTLPGGSPRGLQFSVAVLTSESSIAVLEGVCVFPSPVSLGPSAVQLRSRSFVTEAWPSLAVSLQRAALY